MEYFNDLMTLSGYIFSIVCGVLTFSFANRIYLDDKSDITWGAAIIFVLLTCGFVSITLALGILGIVQFFK